jgi:predicted flap endonuclease-1-like 5' DNA nuclease
MKLESIEGIGPAFAAKLTRAGIKTTSALLKRGTSRLGRKELASVTGISETLLLKWVNRADLMRIKGVGPEYSELLEDAGVDTVTELGRRHVDHLYEKLREINGNKNLVRLMPSRTQVASWVGQARTLPRAVSMDGGSFLRAPESSGGGSIGAPQSRLPGSSTTDAPPPDKKKKPKGK